MIDKEQRAKALSLAYEAQVTLLFRNLVDNIGDAGDSGNLREAAMTAFLRGLDNAAKARDAVDKKLEELDVK